jgi:hypothetical protein
MLRRQSNWLGGALVGLLLALAVGLATGAGSGCILGAVAGYEGQNLLGCCGVIWAGLVYAVYGGIWGGLLGAVLGLAAGLLLVPFTSWRCPLLLLLVVGLGLGFALGWFLSPELFSLCQTQLQPTDRMQRHAPLDPPTAFRWCGWLAGTAAGFAGALGTRGARLMGSDDPAQTS